MPNRPTRRTVLRSATLLAAGAALGGSELLTRPAAAGTLAVPETPLIPSPQEWTPTSGWYFFQTGSRLVVDASYADQLATAAATLSDDLLALTGIRFTPVNDTAANERAGDVFLSLGSTDSRLGDEGYLMTIGPAIRIRARTATGAFFGTRTFLQMLRRSARMRAGTIRDWPRYRERGLLVANAPVKISMPFWQEQIRELSYLKMNLLYLAVGYPNAPVSSIQQVAEFAGRYSITIVPMFGMPSHMNYHLDTRPDLQVTPARWTDLHIGKDIAYTWARDRLQEVVNTIPSPWFHTAADEFMAGSSVQEWEQHFGAYARAHYGANAHPFDTFDGFINFENQIVRAAGRTMRMWNDTIYREGIVSIDRNVAIEHWIAWGRPAADLLADGYQVQNSHIDFTYYDIDGPHKLNPAAIYEQFRIGQFHGSAVSDDHPGLLGSKLHVWTTFPPMRETEAQIAANLMAPERSFAQVLWGSPKQAANYAGFAPIIGAVGRAPGITVADPTAPTMRSVVTTDGPRLFGIAPDGHVMTASWTAAGGWAAWSPIGTGHYHGRTAPNAAVTVLGDDLFTTAPDGRVITTFSSGSGWHDWFTIAGGFYDGKAGANAVVSATMLNGHRQLFTTAPDGRVMSTFRSATDGWHDWFGIPTGFYDGTAAANSVIAATGSQIYTVAPDGHVMSTFWSPDIQTNGGWHGWFAIPTGFYDGRTAANGVVTVGTVNNHTHLFAVAPDGHVMTTFWDPSITTNGGWHEWFAIPTGHADGRAAANTAVTATTVNGNAQLFTVASDGHVMSTFWHRDITTNGGWHEWFAIPTGFFDGKAAPGGRVSFATVNNNPQLFTTSPDRHVGSTFWDPATNPGNGGWHEWFAIPGGHADGQLRG